MRSQLFEIPLFGGIPIHAYGFMIMLGFIAAMLVAAQRIKRYRIDPNNVFDFGLVAMFSGVIGARVWHVLQYGVFAGPEMLPRYGADGTVRMVASWASNPYRAADGALVYSQFFKVWEGGLVFYGGLIGATICVILFCRWRQLSVWTFLDVLAPVVPLGLAFTRVGCFLNGCCFGKPTDSWLGVHFPSIAGERPRLDRDGEPVLRGGKQIIDRLVSLPYARNFLENGREVFISPTTTAKIGPAVLPSQMFSSIGAFVVFLILIAYSRWARAKGEMFFLMLMLYGAHRFNVEWARSDTPRDPYLGLSAGQWMSVFIVLVTLPLFLSRVVARLQDSARQRSAAAA